MKKVVASKKKARKGKVVTGHDTSETTLNDVVNCIERWKNSQEAKGLDVEYYGNFYAMDSKKNFECVDDIIVMFGTKEGLLILMDGHREQIEEIKDDFVCADE